MDSIADATIELPQHYIEIEGSLVQRALRTLKHGDAFAVFDNYGDIGVIGTGPEGHVLHEGHEHGCLRQRGGVNRSGHVVLKRRVMRDQLLTVLAQIDPCTVVVEACTGAFYWARKFEALGHEVKIISPQYVKPFVRRQKNDGNDAEAICTAARQPHIPFVPKKTVEQQDIQALHRARQRMVNHRTAVVSQIRGLLLDRGFAIAKSITRARRAIPEILAGQDNELTAMVRDAIAELYDLFRDLDRRIGLFDKKIDRIFHENEACQRIAKIKGVGPKTATAIVAAIGDGSE
jgi:transposase